MGDIKSPRGYSLVKSSVAVKTAWKWNKTMSKQNIIENLQVNKGNLFNKWCQKNCRNVRKNSETRILSYTIHKG